MRRSAPEAVACELMTATTANTYEFVPKATTKTNSCDDEHNECCEDESKGNHKDDRHEDDENEDDNDEEVDVIR